MRDVIPTGEDRLIGVHYEYRQVARHVNRPLGRLAGFVVGGRKPSEHYERSPALA